MKRITLANLAALTLTFSLSCGVPQIGDTVQPAATEYPWQVAHVTVEALPSGDRLQCPGPYLLLGGSCRCGGVPSPGALATDSLIPAWECGACGGAPVISVTCLRGPAGDLAPTALLNGTPWPP